MTSAFLFEARNPGSPHVPEYPEGFSSEMKVYHWYAEAYQWPPVVVRGLGIKEDFWLRAQKEAACNVEGTLAAEQARQNIS